MIRVEVNGTGYNLYKQVDISGSLDDFSKEAQLIVSEAVDLNSVIKINDKVSIYLDDIKLITGYAEKVNDSESDTSHDLNFKLRTLAADIIDSSCPDDLKNVDGVTVYKDLVSKAVTGLGLNITITDNIVATFNDEVKAAETGKNCFEFLQEYARKVQVFLNTDGDGNIIIRRPGGVLKTHLVEGINILESSINLDYSQRFGTYKVYSNANVTEQKKTTNFNVVGEATDSLVRDTRLFEKISDKPMNADECAFAAIEEANIRRIRSFQYTAKVAGFSANGELWEEGKIVNVTDTKKGVKGIFVIKDVRYNFSEAGEYTTLTMTEPDAYTLEADLSTYNANTVVLADVYQE